MAWAMESLHCQGDNRMWRGQQALFTWSGAFGFLDKEKILGKEWPPVEDVIAILKMGDHLHQERAAMEAFISGLKERHHLDKYCWAFELNEERYEHARSLSRSPETDAERSPGGSSHWSHSSGKELEQVEEEPLRFHAHACLRFHHNVALRPDGELSFEDAYAVPATAASSRKRKAGDFDLAGNAGFFYLQVAKTSCIEKDGNWHPFKNYLVNSDWAVNLWQQGKVTAATARAVIVQAKKNVPHLLNNYDRVQKEMTKTSLEETVTRTRQTLEASMRPCRTVPEVDAWERTFEKIEFRYNFLVLDGPSKMGKTLFCRSRSLGSGGCLLEVDCAGADTPDPVRVRQAHDDFVRRRECVDGPALQEALPGVSVVHAPVLEQDELSRLRRVGPQGEVRRHQQPLVGRDGESAARGRGLAVAEFHVHSRGQTVVGPGDGGPSA